VAERIPHPASQARCAPEEVALRNRLGGNALEYSRQSSARVLKSIPQLVYSLIIGNCQSPDVNIDDDGSIWLESVRIAKGKRLLRRIRSFIVKEVNDASNLAAVSKIAENEKRASEVQPRLQDGARKLIMRIEAGEPLLGGCDTCPKVFIRTESK